VFDLGTDASRQPLDLSVYLSQTITQVRLSALTWSHRNMPAYRVSLATFFDPPISGFSVHIGFVCA
jgi:hypothetical protein